MSATTRLTELTAAEWLLHRLHRATGANLEVPGRSVHLSALGLRRDRHGFSGPFNMMLRSPVMGQRLFAMLDYLRFNTSVPRKLNEFAILIQAWLWTSQVAWAAHYPLALKAGLPQAVADDLKVGKRPASMQPDEAAVYDLTFFRSAG